MGTEASSSGMLWAGWVVTGLVILFLIFDGGTKVLEVAPVIEACARVGLTANMAVGIGTILLTAFLGGAVAIHVRAGNGAFEIAFPIAFGGLTWLGLVLREPRVLWTILLRQ